MSHSEIHSKDSLANEIRSHTGVAAVKCYQCGKCTAGCPLTDEMDIMPSVVMRMLQTGEKEAAEQILRSYTIWVCLTCEMCYGRCPMEIDIPGIMDYLREKSLMQKKTNPKAKHIIAFHKAFLDSLEQTGRLYELGLTLDYKIRSLKLSQDLMLAPKMVSRGKLGFLPEMVRDRKNIARIFQKTKNKENH